MSGTVHVRELHLTMAGADVLVDVSLSVFPGQRLGIVGPNGVGKSTLLQVVAGQRAPDRGSVALSPRSATVGYLPQEPDRQEGETVLDFLARRTGAAGAQRALDEATRALEQGETDAGAVYAEALERWLALGGADLDQRAERVLAQLGISPALAARPTVALSGGQAARVSLASILLSRFDVLLLDEPTNDLDFDGLARLEVFVRDVDAAVAVVSHDRAFLDAVVTDVVELDAHTRSATAFSGGWAAYRASTAVAQRHAEEDYETYAARRDALQARAQRQRLWSRRGVSTAKQKRGEKDKFVRAHNIATSEKMAAKSRATERAIERLETVEKPWRHWDLQLSIAEAPRSGAVVARLEGAVVARGDFRLGPVDLSIRWAERVAVVGPNGAGKTTLVSALLQRTPLVAGSAWLGPGVVVGEIRQTRGAFADAPTLLDGFLAATAFAPADARTLLAKFGLGPAHIARPTASLSPGERTRASLALFQARSVNTLVLDEPTNHLDLPAIEQLEAAIERFGGTILLITHDRRLLERFGATRILEISAGCVREGDLPSPPE